MQTANYVETSHSTLPQSSRGKLASVQGWASADPKNGCFPFDIPLNSSWLKYVMVNIRSCSALAFMVFVFAPALVALPHTVTLSNTLDAESRGGVHRSPDASSPQQAQSSSDVRRPCNISTQLQAQVLLHLAAVSASCWITPGHNSPGSKNCSKGTAACLDALDVSELRLHQAAVSAKF